MLCKKYILYMCSSAQATIFILNESHYCLYIPSTRFIHKTSISSINNKKAGYRGKIGSARDTNVTYNTSWDKTEISSDIVLGIGEKL
jgi:hypothetical protein